MHDMTGYNVLPRVLELRQPTALVVPLVFDSPHSGTDYPADFEHLAPISAIRRAEDTFVDELYAAAPAHGAALLRALFPRSYVDPNRAAGDLDLGMIEGEWTGAIAPSQKCALGLGLLWSRYPPGLPLYGRKLSVAEVRKRIDVYHKPYHDTLRSVLDRVHSRFGVVWHINCHSMPALSNEMAAEGPGVMRPDFTLGDRDGTTCAPAFTEAVRAALSARGYRVTVNDPYKGAELVRAWSNPAAGRHSLQIEINRRLYMNEDTFEKSEGFERLRDDITGLIEELAEFAKTSLR
jgi:N-formylglutamate amidohydrolase